MKKTAFVAKNHLCWFSKNPAYKLLTVEQVFKKDPDYIIWCFDNLSFLRFATGLSNRIKTYKQASKKQTI